MGPNYHNPPFGFKDSALQRYAVARWLNLCSASEGNWPSSPDGTT